MPELWELVNSRKEKTGIIHERGKEDSIPSGMYHMVVDVWVKNKYGEILLTQRHPDKPYGLLWECSGGSVIAGESSIDAACRELSEETGIHAEPSDLIYLGDTLNINWITETYLFKTNQDEAQLSLQDEEVVDAVWLTPAQLEERKDAIVDSVFRRYCQYRDVILAL